MTLSYFLVLSLLIWSYSVGAVNQCQRVPSVSYLPSQVYQQAEFRIYYDLSGQHALVHQQDHNRNNVPDVVEDMATQLVVARRLYSDVLLLVHPLKQPRFEGVKDIRIRLLDIESSHGKAYDEPHRFPDQKQTGGCSLMVKMSHRLDPETFTPVHELFHLYQYGYAPFKTRWYLEGTARWAESLLNDKTQIEEPLPTAEKLNVFFKRTYDASRVWQTLASKSDSLGWLSIPPDVAAMRYVDGRSVVVDAKLQGGAYMKRVLEIYARYGIEKSKVLGIDPYHWDEALQTSNQFDLDLWQLAVSAVKE